VNKISAFDAESKSLTSAIGVESAKLYPNSAQRCKHSEAMFFGPYDSDLGFYNLSLMYGWRTSEIKVALDRLNNTENKLLAQTADATLNGKKPDPKVALLLSATRAAAIKLAPLYEQMAAEKAYLLSIKDGESQDVYGEVCGRKPPTPTPSPSPTPKKTAAPVPTPVPTPTPKPTPTPSPAPSHCPGGQVYFPGLGCRNNPM